MPTLQDQAQDHQEPSTTDQRSLFGSGKRSAADKVPHELLANILSSAFGSAGQSGPVDAPAHQDSLPITARASLLINKPFYFAGVEIWYANNQLRFSSIADSAKFVEHTGIDRCGSIKSIAIISHWDIASIYEPWSRLTYQELLHGRLAAGCAPSVPTGGPEYTVTPLDSTHDLTTLPEILAKLPKLRKVSVIVVPHIYAGIRKALKAAAPCIEAAFQGVIDSERTELEILYEEA